MVPEFVNDPKEVHDWKTSSPGRMRRFFSILHLTAMHRPKSLEFGRAATREHFDTNE
jgi:hypothetical protein